MRWRRVSSNIYAHSLLALRHIQPHQPFLRLMAPGQAIKAGMLAICGGFRAVTCASMTGRICSAARQEGCEGFCRVQRPRIRRVWRSQQIESGNWIGRTLMDGFVVVVVCSALVCSARGRVRWSLFLFLFIRRGV